MLRYLGTGLRDYRRAPIRPDRRGWWEFQAVVAGRIGWTADGGRLGEGWAEQRLWLFAPEFRHGWQGDGASAEVVVFHFSWLPDGLDRLVRSAGGLVSVAIDHTQCRCLREWAQLAAEHMRRPRASSPTQHLCILAGLGQLMWQGLGDRPLLDQHQADHQRVEDAVQWYRQHLYFAPTVEQVAAAVFCSPAHLRRLFHQQREESPAAALLQVRLQRAQELIEQGELSLGTVAEEAGFRSQAVFSRVFRQVHGMTPGAWRQRRRHHSG